MQLSCLRSFAQYSRYHLMNRNKDLSVLNHPLATPWDEKNISYDDPKRYRKCFVWKLCWCSSSVLGALLQYSRFPSMSRSKYLCVLNHPLAAYLPANEGEIYFHNDTAKYSEMASTLQDLWLEGKEGCLSPLEQCRAWALREVYRELGTPEKKLYTKVAEKLTKVGGGQPTSRAVLLLFEKVDNSDDWYPGKVEEGRGRKPALTGLARSAIQRSAESIKRNGGEPTYGRILASCPEAVKNPDTGKPVSKKRVYDVFEKHCHDDGQEKPWKNRSRLTKSALPEEVMEKRLEWQVFMVGLGHSAAWFYKNMVWFDLCNSIIPTSEKKASEQALARKSGKGWMSPGSQEYSKNLRGKKECLKQNSWDTFKVWWMPVLTRGKLHVECFDADFLGECPEGAAAAAKKLGPILNIRFPNENKPKVAMTDRGRGFYRIFNAKITGEYKAALQSVGMRPFMGDVASNQPGKLGDMMLHETAVAWIRLKLQNTCPVRAWQETREQYKARLQQICRDINSEYDVEGLCRELPDRLEDLRERKGDALKK